MNTVCGAGVTGEAIPVPVLATNVGNDSGVGKGTVALSKSVSDKAACACTAGRVESLAARVGLGADFVGIEVGPVGALKAYIVIPVPFTAKTVRG